MASKSYYEKYYPGPFQPVPKLEEVEGGGGSGVKPADAPTGYLEGNDAAGSAQGSGKMPFESEGEGSKGPAAR